MRAQARELSNADKQAVAEFLSGKKLELTSLLDPPACVGAAARFDVQQAPPFTNWGLRDSNTRNLGRPDATLDARNVHGLRLKWAVGFDGAMRVRSQPTFAGGALYIGSESGKVFALGQESGCKRWEFQASAEVRTAIVAAPWSSRDLQEKPLLFFGDLVGNVYAIDAQRGSVVWHDRPDSHPSATITAAPVIYDGVLYVAVSSLEEASAGANYECCSFRGSVVAYTAATGRRLWKTYLVDEPRLLGRNAVGVKRFGPSGVAVWNSPAIDPGRNALYVGTSDNYSSPATDLSDSIVALDLSTGRVRWSYQALARDAWNGSCDERDNSECPVERGPDFDFGAAAMLVKGADGTERVIAGAKSGWVYAVEPDNGTLAWKARVGRGGILGGVYFGMSAATDRIFVPINDAPDGRTYRLAAQPGIYSLNISTGRLLWSAPLGDGACHGRPLCASGIAAPATTINDLVVTGSGDGRVRIFAADDGRLLWEYDTTRRQRTVSGAFATGGSIGGGAGPVAYHNMLAVGSGYGWAGRMPGNLLLVFESK
jgi:polyvinyl alcohol dehydrogenase (cytochrome)